MKPNHFQAQAVSRDRAQPNAIATLFFVCGFVHIASLLRQRPKERTSLTQRLTRGLNQQIARFIQAVVFV